MLNIQKYQETTRTLGEHSFITYFNHVNTLKLNEIDKCKDGHLVCYCFDAACGSLGLSPFRLRLLAIDYVIYFSALCHFVIVM